MAIEVLSSGEASTSRESFTFTVDYDTAAQTIGLTCVGNGHSTLAVIQTSTSNVLGALNGDQYGTTNGPLTNGASASPVTYTGQRVIVLGPGATGVDDTGQPLSTHKISSNVVGQFNVGPGQTPDLQIALTWWPDS